MTDPFGHQLYFILDTDRRPVSVDVLTWGRWYEDADNRRVAETFTELYRVSTVFLGIDHRFSGKGPPILFETMVFEKEPHLREIFGDLREVHDDIGECERYATWDDAEAGHNAMVKRILKREKEAAQIIKDAKEFVRDIADVAAALGGKREE